MNICYCDETGIGQEDYAVMCGIIADDQRMHKTKAHWEKRIEELNSVIEEYKQIDRLPTEHKPAKKGIKELHARDFIPGNAIWSKVSGDKRAEITNAILDWLIKRDHKAVILSADKKGYDDSIKSDAIDSKLNSIWKCLAFQLVLGVQKYQQQKTDPLNGHTIIVFDNEESEKDAFAKLIHSSKNGNDNLDMIIDVPYFADSKFIPLIQVADLLCYLCRRHLLISLHGEKYPGERVTIDGYMEKIRTISIKSKYTYPDPKNPKAHAPLKPFYDIAPKVLLERLKKV